MRSRSNQLLLGIIVLLLGLLILFQKYIVIDLFSIMLIICGSAFVISYKTKHKNWSLILGGYMVYIGAIRLINPYISGFDTLNIIGAMFFIVPGIIFFILYFEKGKLGLLFPASFMVWFGLFSIAKNISFIAVNNFSLFLAFAGFAFYTVNCFHKSLVSRWTFHVGTVFIILSIIFMGGLSKFVNLLTGLPQVAAVILILLSIVIIIKALLDHKE